MNNFFLTLLCLLFPLHVMAQICKTDSIIESTPDTRFSINGDGTVTDATTGLMWMRCSLGQTWNSSSSSCDDMASEYTWSEAFSAAEGSAFAGHSDWRVPNIKALSSIVEIACNYPSINETAFPNTSASVYWSSSSNAYGSHNAWVVYFNSGNASYYGYNFGKSNYVRLVRGGQ